MTFSTYFSPGVALQGGGGSSGGGGAASAPLTGTGATVTTSQPLINVSQTWNNAAVTFTGMQFNAAGTSDANSAAGSLLMDLQVGGASRFSVTKAGGLTIQAGASLTADGGALYINRVINSSGSTTNSFDGSVQVASIRAFQWSDLFLSRRGAANLRLGAADAAAPVAQTLSVQSVVAGTTNTAGTNLTITGSQGTGSGAGGSLIFQVAPAGSSGSAQNALATALTINSARRAEFAATTSTTPTIGFSGDSSSGFASANGFDVFYTRAGSPMVFFGFNRIDLGTGNLTWSSSVGGTSDVLLTRDTIATLALRNGTNAQRFNVYNTWTSSTNYETFKIDWITTANTVLVGTEKGSGGGNARALAFQTDGTTRLTIATSGAATFSAGITATGTLTFTNSNPQLIGGGNGWILDGNSFSCQARATGLTTMSTGNVQWTDGNSYAGNVDTILAREAAGVTGVRGANTTTGGALGFIEQTAPAAPAANGVRIYAEDNGSGKTRLMAIFATGAAQQIAIEP